VRAHLKAWTPTYDVEQAQAAKSLVLVELSHLHADQLVTVEMNGSISRYDGKESRNLSVKLAPLGVTLLLNPSALCEPVQPLPEAEAEAMFPVVTPADGVAS
jgi:hypothetical protein